MSEQGSARIELACKGLISEHPIPEIPNGAASENVYPEKEDTPPEA